MVPSPCCLRLRHMETPMTPDDPRHGTTNGYNNLRCRCQLCRTAWTEHMRQRQTKIECGGGVQVSVPHAFRDRLKAFADAHGRSMRSIAMEAIEDYMWVNR